MAKHYVRLNEKGEVVKGFSDELEVPETEDVLVNEDGNRHFEIAGEITTIFKDGDIYLYVYKNGEIKRKTDRAIQKEQEAIDSARLVEPSEMETIKATLIEYGVIINDLFEAMEG